MSVIVYTPGCWDLLHVGHLNFLRSASELGDKLIVGVASDYVVKIDKGIPPIIPEDHRCVMVQAIKRVDIASIYHKLEFITHLDCFKPDILAVGEQWGDGQRHQGAEVWCNIRGARLVKIPRFFRESSSDIKTRVIDSWRNR